MAFGATTDRKSAQYADLRHGGSIAINKPDPMLTSIRDGNSSVDYYDPADLETEVGILRSDLLSFK